MKIDLYKKYFENKKITALGLGLLGRGLGDTEFLLKNVKEVICTDTRDENKLAESIKEIKKDNPENLTLIIGENRMQDFENRDFVITCAGMQRDYPYLTHAKENNIPIYMSAALLTKIIYENLPNVKVIGVTGTRGKSTTTMMIHNMLTVAGKRVHLGGNVRGVANLPLLDEIEDGDYLLMELDSWQLQGFGDLQISPQIAVFTSFLDDHLNYYKGDREAYFADKANIFLNQKDTDKLIISKDIEEKINNFCIEKNIKRNIIVGHTFLQNMNLIGHHNQVLARLVNEVGIQLGLDYDDIVKGISSFKAVEGRLEYMGEFNPLSNSPQGARTTQNAIHVYNDNNATTPDATIVGVEALNEKYKRSVTLICGGADKGLDLNNLVKVITDKSKVNKLILLAGTGTEKLKDSLTPALSKGEGATHQHKEFETLAECVEEGMRDGGILLYSPGFASFSKYFKNEYEKNDEFVRCVKDGGEFDNSIKNI